MKRFLSLAVAMTATVASMAHLFVGQVAAVAITLVYCFFVSYAIIWLIGRVIRVRVPEEEEVVGADIAEHGEPAYCI